MFLIVAKLEQVQRRVLWASLFILVLLAITILPVAAGGTDTFASFTGTPTSGSLPFTVSFTDSSTGSPDGWAWFFGDENFTAPWTQMTDSADWTARDGHSSVVLSKTGEIMLMGGKDSGGFTNVTWLSTSGSVWTSITPGDPWWTARAYHSSVAMPGITMLMGGKDSSGFTNDTWLSIDGPAWEKKNASSGWAARAYHSSVATLDNSIVLMGGWDGSTYYNDVWNSTDLGVTWTLVNASAGWTARAGHTSVAMPDGSIVLMGGQVSSTNYKNDVWRSTDNGTTWTLVNASAGWSARGSHSSVVMPDGSIVLMGGWDGDDHSSRYNNVWRSTDNGAMWTKVNASAGWTARNGHSSVAMPDGSIVLMGGVASAGDKNDVWQFQPAGSLEKDPSHTYTAAGIYQVALEVYKTLGKYNSTRTAGYITVTSPAPVGAFSGTPTTGTFPLTVSFSDTSTNTPTGWAWFFGDETYTQPWTRMNASAGWTGRYQHSSVAMPDGSIVLMGGWVDGGSNDTWRSTNNGTTWTQVNTSSGWSTRYQHSSVTMPDGSIVLMGGYSYVGGWTYMNDVWRSTDNGAMWTNVNAGAGWTARRMHSSVAMPDGSIVLMGGYGGGFKNDVWRSTDNGATWAQMKDNIVNANNWSARYGHTSVAMPDGSIVLMGGQASDGPKNDIWRSTDNGATWTNITGSPGWSARSYHTSVAMPDGSIVLMGGGDPSTNDTWRSTNNGTTWTQVNTSSGWTSRDRHSSVAMPDGSIVLMGGYDNSVGNKNDVWRFVPTGSSAKNPSHTYTAAGVFQVALQAFNTGGYNSTRKTSYITVTTPPPVAAFSGTPTSGTAPLAVQFTDASTNSPTGWAWFFGDETYTQPWTQQTAGAGWAKRSGHSSVVMPDSSIVLMGGYDGSSFKNDTWRSTDNGATWTQLNVSSGWSARQSHTSVALPDGSIVLMGGYNYISPRYKNDTWRSTDNGATWTKLTSSAGWAGRSGHISVAMPDSSIVLMGGSDGVKQKNDTWRSTNNGVTWTQMTASAGWSTRESPISVVMPDGSIVLMGGGDDYKNDTWRSTDNGAMWTLMNASSGWSARWDHSSVVMPDGSIVLMGGVAYAGGSSIYYNDTWRSTDNGAIWTRMNTSSGWTARRANSVAMPDGSIVLMGDDDGSATNDVWRFQPAGSSAQNPLHAYNTVGIYQVALQAFNSVGYNSTRTAGYITCLLYTSDAADE